MKAWKTAGCKGDPGGGLSGHGQADDPSGGLRPHRRGGESGGHVGDLTTMVLVPPGLRRHHPARSGRRRHCGQSWDRRSLYAGRLRGPGRHPLPGSRGCSVHPVYKEKILKASDIATITTGKRLGHPVRSLKTPSPGTTPRRSSAPSPMRTWRAGPPAPYAWRPRRATSGPRCFLAGQVADDPSGTACGGGHP